MVTLNNYFFRDEDSASCSSSQRLSANMSLSTMTASVRQKESLPQLTPSLANYYKEVLVEHVTCWQGDQVDRQVNVLILVISVFDHLY